MKCALLSPTPIRWEPFSRNKAKFVPDGSGCYVLTTFEDHVLYVGLAVNLRRRFNDHLDNPEKTKPTEEGRATKFYWVETTDNNRIERTWLNIHVSNEGRYPLLNKVFSPT